MLRPHLLDERLEESNDSRARTQCPCQACACHSSCLLSSGSQFTFDLHIEIVPCAGMRGVEYVFALGSLLLLCRK